MRPDLLRRDDKGFARSQRIEDNLAALALLTNLQAEDNRKPTEEEREVLAKYVGFGGLGELFDPRAHSGYEVRQRITDMVTNAFGAEAYESLRETILTAHFTPYEVVTWMWRAMEKMGLKAGDRVLDPAAGTGYFGALRPDGLSMTNVELDPINARILKLLAPDDLVINSGFEKAPLSHGSFEAAITNVPFGNFPVHDREYFRDRSLPPMSIHNYYFIKSLDKLKVGGVMAYVTSAHTMDAKGGDVRRAIHERGGDLIAAIRLPADTFKVQANVDVNTDILFFQKRDPSAEPSHDAIPFSEWGASDPMIFEGESNGNGKVNVNRYFQNHWPAVLGTIVPATGQFGPTYRVAADRADGETISDYLQRRLIGVTSRIPPDVMKGINREISFSESDGIVESHNDNQGFVVPNGSYVLNQAGKVGTLARGDWQPLEKPLPARREKLVAQFTIVRDAALAVFRAQADQASENDYLDARRVLNEAYDRFVKANGPLTPRLEQIKEDPSISIVLGIEHYDPDTKIGTKSDLFTKRTIERPTPITKADTVHEALLASMCTHGEIVPQYMVNLMAKSWESIAEELGDRIYRNPGKGGWETAEHYLSGNVVEKLTIAQEFASTNSEFSRNVTALEAVRPSRLPFGDINIQMGARWIPTEVFNDFAVHYLGMGKSYIKPEFKWDQLKKAWDFNLKPRVHTVDPAIASTKGTTHLHVFEVLESAMGMGAPTITTTVDDGRKVILVAETAKARAAVDRAKDAFSQWVAESPDRVNTILDEYHNKVRVFVERKYDGSYLDFKGTLASGVSLYPHQLDGVARGLEDGGTLFAHCVGAGKSALMGGLAMMGRKMQMYKKSGCVVPKNLLFQMPAEIKKFYPGARVLIVTNDDLKKGNRQKFLYKVAANQWDMVVITKEAFGRIPLSAERAQRYFDGLAKEAKAILRASKAKGGSSSSLKNQEKQAKRIVARLEARGDALANKKDEFSICFEDLGMDCVMVDEAQYFKNMAVQTELENVAGINTSQSQRAEDMLMKAEYIRSLHGGRRGFYAATATPISNSMTEMFTMATLVAPDALADVGIECFDDFAHLFGKVVQSLEQSPSGQTYRYVQRFSEFNNVPEMLHMFRAFADIKTRAMLKLPEPDMVEDVVVTGIDSSQAAFKKTLAIRAAACSGRSEKGKDNVLVIGTDFRLGMLDMRLFSDKFPHNPRGRVSQAAQRIADIFHATRDVKGTQLAFSDFSSPKGHSQSDLPDGAFSVPEALRDECIERGIPKEMIAFAQDVKTDEQRAAQHQRVRSGEIAVYIGSTGTMGVGANVQNRVVALHHMDLPHRPTDVDQRVGRGRRQGNLMMKLIPDFKLQNFIYATEGYTREHEAMKIKSGFIEAAYSDPDKASRTIEEGAQDRWEDIMAMATDNPVVKDKAVTDQQLRLLEVERDTYFSTRRTLTSRLSQSRSWLAQQEATFANEREILASNEVAKGDPKIMTVDGVDYDGLKKAGMAIIQALDDKGFFIKSTYRRPETARDVARYMGFSMHVAPARHSDSLGELLLVPANQLDSKPLSNIYLGDSPMGIAACFRNQVDRFISRHSDRTLDMDRGREDITSLEKEAQNYTADWPKENLYHEQKEKAAVLSEALLAITQQFSAETAKLDPEMIEMTRIINRRGKPMLPPSLLGLEPEQDEDVLDLDTSPLTEVEDGAEDAPIASGRIGDNSAQQDAEAEETEGASP